MNMPVTAAIANALTPAVAAQPSAHELAGPWHKVPLPPSVLDSAVVVRSSIADGMASLDHVASLDNYDGSIGPSTKRYFDSVASTALSASAQLRIGADGVEELGVSPATAGRLRESADNLITAVGAGRDGIREIFNTGGQARAEALHAIRMLDSIPGVAEAATLNTKPSGLKEMARHFMGSRSAMMGAGLLAAGGFIAGAAIF